jgi:hypothetical protein
MMMAPCHRQHLRVSTWALGSIIVLTLRRLTLAVIAWEVEMNDFEIVRKQLNNSLSKLRIDNYCSPSLLLEIEINKYMDALDALDRIEDKFNYTKDNKPMFSID